MLVSQWEVIDTPSVAMTKRNGFPLVELVLSPISKLWVTSKVFMPLLHTWGYPAMLVIDMLHGCHSWVGHFTTSVIWKSLWKLLVPWKLSHRDVEFRPLLVQMPPGLISEVCGAISNRDLPSTSGELPRGISLSYMFWRSLQQLWSTTHAYYA